MIIEKTSAGKCVDCGKKSTKFIDDKFYCGHCGDTMLLLIMKKCMSHIEHATVKISVLPKSKIWEKGKRDAKEKLSAA